MIGPGTYLRVQPEQEALRPRPYERPADVDPPVSAFAARPPPDMPAGAVLLIGGKPCLVSWADGAWAVVEIDGRFWMISHMTPAEMNLHRNAHEPGSRVQEWIVRRAVDAPAKTAH